MPGGGASPPAGHMTDRPTDNVGVNVAYAARCTGAVALLEVPPLPAGNTGYVWAEVCQALGQGILMGLGLSLLGRPAESRVARKAAAQLDIGRPHPCPDPCHRAYGPIMDSAHRSLTSIMLVIGSSGELHKSP